MKKNDLKNERFLRSIGIITEADLDRLQNLKIAIGGLGLGGSIFLNLVRMGFENFHLADPDIFERTNINRQRLATESTIGKRKDDCSVKEALAINPAVQIKLFRNGVKPTNVEEFLTGVDWVVDVVDLFAMSDKLLLNEIAHRKNLPVASCATLGFSGSIVVFNNKTPSFAELTGISNDLPYAENLKRFLQFICPAVPVYMHRQIRLAMARTSYIPFITPGGEISAAFAASEITKQILGMGRCIVAPNGVFIDAYDVKLQVFNASHLARNFQIAEISDPVDKKAA